MMGLLKWWGRRQSAKKRVKILSERIATLNKLLAVKDELLEVYNENAEVDIQLIAATLASINHHVMRGEEWSSVYAWHINKLGEKYAAPHDAFRDLFTLNDPRDPETNLDPHPVFDFPITFNKDDACKN